MKKTYKEVPIIYNLFPRHFYTFDDWIAEIPRIAEMGFNALFVNPFFETGCSGSLYAIKNFYRLNPLFLKKNEDPKDFTPVVRLQRACEKVGIGLIIDLVINHTAIDSVLTETKPQWYKRDGNGNIISPFAIDPMDESNVTVWGDLGTIDNEESEEKEALWKYWDDLINFFQQKNINGFRCDAAYQVSASLWKYLISAAKKRDKRATFFAETLGCRIEQVEALAPSGFDYLFNSVKWWNYDQPWALEQHTLYRNIAPSVAFPESHDTERLASEQPGTIDVQKSRYAFASLFSQGILIPGGYEFGAITRINVVVGTPKDVDPVKWDISQWIRKINRLKLENPVLSAEGKWRTLTSFGQSFLFLEKSMETEDRRVYVCVNREQTKETAIEEWMIPEEIKKCSKTMSLLLDTPDYEPVPEAFTLDPADVVLFVP